MCKPVYCRLVAITSTDQHPGSTTTANTTEWNAKWRTAAAAGVPLAAVIW